jgi:hypothetical protein
MSNIKAIEDLKKRISEVKNEIRVHEIENALIYQASDKSNNISKDYAYKLQSFLFHYQQILKSAKNHLERSLPQKIHFEGKEITMYATFSSFQKYWTAKPVISGTRYSIYCGKKIKNAYGKIKEFFVKNPKIYAEFKQENKNSKKPKKSISISRDEILKDKGHIFLEKDFEEYEQIKTVLNEEGYIERTPLCHRDFTIKKANIIKISDETMALKWNEIVVIEKSGGENG